MGPNPHLSNIPAGPAPLPSSWDLRSPDERSVSSHHMNTLRAESPLAGRCPIPASPPTMGRGAQEGRGPCSPPSSLRKGTPDAAGGQAMRGNIRDTQVSCFFLVLRAERDSLRNGNEG